MTLSAMPGRSFARRAESVGAVLEAMALKDDPMRRRSFVALAGVRVQAAAQARKIDKICSG